MNPRPPASDDDKRQTTYRKEASLLATVRHLWPYVWPHDRADLKFRVIGAMGITGAGQARHHCCALFLQMGDRCADRSESGFRIPLPVILAGPIALCIIYGLLRSFMQFFTQARDALFAAVSMNAVRQIANEVFVHLHQLSLRFHLERKTGGLTRVLERGREAIQQIVRMSMLTGFPTIVEFALIMAVFLYAFDWRYAAILVVMIVAYLWFTRVCTDWRITIRRNMNESDNDANVKAIDSLLNYETVKYFSAGSARGRNATTARWNAMSAIPSQAIYRWQY